MTPVTEAAQLAIKSLMRFVSVVFLSILTCNLSSFVQLPDKPGAEVKGVVTDVSDSRVTKAILIFENGGQSYRVETGEDGAYEVRLKPNTYTVSITHFGFCRSRRAAFVAKKDSLINFDFQLWVCPSDGYGKYNFIKLEPVPHTHLQPLILFGEARPEGTSQIFTGAVLTEKYPVVLTYNLLSLRANRLTYERSKHLLWAEGNVEWQDGTKEGIGKIVQIWLDGPEPRVIPFTWQK
jgi:Carboxypeptidase regulatory-like domain